MFNALSRVKPEIKEDTLFQKGLKTISYIQIGLLALLIVFYAICITVGGVPLTMQLFNSIVMRVLAILALSTGYKAIMILFSMLTAVWAVGLTFIFVVYMNQLNSFGIFIYLFEIILVLATLVSYIYVFMNKDTRYIIEVTRKVRNELKEKNKTKISS